MRTEPLLLAEGRLERLAAGRRGDQRLRPTASSPLDAPDRAAAEVKDFSPLDLRELERQAGGGLARAAAAAGGGPDDFRAVAPPVMNFARGRAR